MINYSMYEDMDDNDTVRANHPNSKKAHAESVNRLKKSVSKTNQTINLPTIDDERNS